MFLKVVSSRIGRDLLSQGCHNGKESVLLQFVRYRKRRWAPISKSKIYYVRKPHEGDPEEAAYLKSEWHKYTTLVRGIQKYFRQELLSKDVASGSITLVEEEENRFAKFLEENDEWNQNTAKIREARQSKEEAELQEQKLQKILQAEEEQRRKQELAQKHVQMEMEKAKYFVTQETLEEEIEKALNMRANYNFAIDTEGNRYVELPDGSTSVETKESSSVHTFTNLDTQSEQKSSAV